MAIWGSGTGRGRWFRFYEVLYHLYQLVFFYTSHVCSFLLYLFSFLFIWLEEKRVWFKLLRGHCCLYICELWRWINNSCAVADYWCPCNDNKVNWEIYYHILFTTLSLLLLLSGSCGYYSSIFGDIEVRLDLCTFHTIREYVNKY